MRIGTASLDDADVRALITEHQRRMYESSPPGTSFALDLDGLRQPEITMIEAREGAELLGVAALKALSDEAGEIKSMRTADGALRKGVGQALLDALCEIGRERGYAKLMLETGQGPVFEAANALYLKNGFIRRKAFGGYCETDFNIFYEKSL